MGGADPPTLREGSSQSFSLLFTYGGWRRAIANERGQGLAEAGIAITLFVVLTMGMIEFGRAWMVGNMITQAARDGARTASVASPANRNADGTVKSTYFDSTIKPQIQAQIQNVLDSTTVQALTYSMTPLTSGGVTEVQVTVSGSVPLIFNLPFVGSTLSVNRVVTFKDEGR